MLARILQRLLHMGKNRFPRHLTPGKSASTFVPKAYGKMLPQSSMLWKERQLRDYHKANGLCFFCGEKYDPSHLEHCTKRPKVQVNALALNDFNVELNDEILTQLYWQLKIL